MINQIIADCDGVKIDIEDDGSVVIYHKDQAAIDKAVAAINEICREAKIGDVYEGKVVRVEKLWRLRQPVRKNRRPAPRIQHPAGTA